MFTQQHYIAIAKIIRDQDVYSLKEGAYRRDGNTVVHSKRGEELVEAFVKAFEQDNSKFDAERFRNACKRPLEQVDGRYVGKYIVWVGGIDNHYETREQAEFAVREWTAKGYTDVQLEPTQEETIGHMWVMDSRGVEYDGALVAPI